MSHTSSYSIRLTTDFAEWSRYNVFIMGSCRSADGASDDFIHLISKGDPDNRFTPSSDARRHLRLDTPSCASFELYIYIVSNRLPASRIVSQSPPFEVRVTISGDCGEVYAKTHSVNQWGGATIYIEHPKE